MAGADVVGQGIRRLSHPGDALVARLVDGHLVANGQDAVAVVRHRQVVLSRQRVYVFIVDGVVDPLSPVLPYCLSAILADLTPDDNRLVVLLTVACQQHEVGIVGRSVRPVHAGHVVYRQQRCVIVQTLAKPLQADAVEADLQGVVVANAEYLVGRGTYQSLDAWLGCRVVVCL